MDSEHDRMTKWVEKELEWVDRNRNYLEFFRSHQFAILREGIAITEQAIEMGYLPEVALKWIELKNLNHFIGAPEVVFSLNEHISPLINYWTLMAPLQEAGLSPCDVSVPLEFEVSEKNNLYLMLHLQKRFGPNYDNSVEIHFKYSVPVPEPQAKHLKENSLLNITQHSYSTVSCVIPDQGTQIISDDCPF